jgi:hypothetical protein
MNRITKAMTTAGVCALIAACGTEPSEGPPATSTAALSFGKPLALLVQQGENLVVLASQTDDGYVLYWDGGSVYATLLYPGAARIFVAAAVQPPMVVVHGRVAMIWTSQTLANSWNGSVSPSPLIVWTAQHGAKAASTSSLASALGSISAPAAVSPDSNEVLFLSNVSADGTTGDVVRAPSDLSATTTLVAGVSSNQFGACPPHVGYDLSIPGGRAQPIVLSCVLSRAGSATVATLSKWNGGTQVVLSTNILAGSFWDGDAFGRRIVATAADGSTVVFDADGTSTTIETQPAYGWVNDDGTVFTLVGTTATTTEIHRVTLGPALRTEVVATVAAAAGFQPHHLPQGVPYYHVSTHPTSPDGHLLVLETSFSPAGYVDAALVDLTQTNETPVVFEPNPIAGFWWDVFTQDSSHAIFQQGDSTLSNFANMAAARDGTVRQLSATFNDATESYALHDSVVAFAEPLLGTQNGAPFGQTNLEVADVSARTISREAIASGANLPYYTALALHALVYTSDANADTSARGLFVAVVR